MKLTRKVTALILVLVLFCTIATPAMAADNTPDTRAEYVEMVAGSGTPAITTAEFMAKWNAASDFFRLITGDKFPSSEKINVAFDEYLVAANTHMVKNSGIDIIATAEALPSLNAPAEFIGEKIQLDTVAFRVKMYELRDESLAKGDKTTADLYNFLGAYMSIVKKMYFYTVPTENPSVYELYLEVTYKDGAKESVGTNLLIDSVSGEVYGKKGNGIFAIGFNFNIKEMMLYALVNAWHRDLGYAVLYDRLADIIPVWNIITRRYYFDYNGLEWLIQAWKGNYFLVSSGAEVGVYNRVPGEELGTFYNCANDEQLMTMTMRLSHNDTTLLNLGPEKHWWINGFKLNGMTYEPTDLKLEFSIEMPNMEMANAFTEAIENEENGDTSYKITGTTVSVAW